MNILDKIISHKRRELERRKELYPVPLLEKSIYFQTQPVSLKKYIKRPDKVGIIAEIKRRSPSKGVLNEHISIENLSIAYMQAGASALSVLSDNEFFGGSNNDLREARKFNFCPILRKDFVFDEYQVYEAKSIGADVVLLIARILDPAQLGRLASCARALGMETLLEVHDRRELDDFLCDEIDIVGVNNRNLDTLEIDIETSFTLGELIPGSFLKISESGIDNAETIMRLKENGFSGFLIGEAFMKSSRPEQECARLVRELHT